MEDVIELSKNPRRTDGRTDGRPAGEMAAVGKVYWSDEINVFEGTKGKGKKRSKGGSERGGR